MAETPARTRRRSTQDADRAHVTPLSTPIRPAAFSQQRGLRLDSERTAEVIRRGGARGRSTFAECLDANGIGQRPCRPADSKADGSPAVRRQPSTTRGVCQPESPLVGMNDLIDIDHS